MFKRGMTLTVILFSFVLVNAQKSELSDAEIINIYSKVGDIHNKGLDVIFEKLNNQYKGKYDGPGTAEGRNRLFKTIDDENMAFVTAELSVKNIPLSQFTKIEFDLRDCLNDDLVSMVKRSNEGRTLSPGLISALQELNTVVDDETRCYEKKNYDQIASRYIGRLSSFKEKVYLVSCVSTGFSSIQYWASNQGKWQKLFGGGSYAFQYQRHLTVTTLAPFHLMAPPLQKNVGRSIAKADVSGIIWGGGIGCIAGALGGTVAFPVVGTIAGCAGVGAAGAVTGGLGGSAKAAIDSFLDWLF